MPTTRLKIFISSVQKEFASVRRDLKSFLLGDAFLRRFVADVFLFEELPARDQHSGEAYLAEVERCDIYLGIFGNDYGHMDKTGVSPTDHEYRYATRLGKTRLIYLWGTDDTQRDPGMKALIRRANAELIRRRVADPSTLNAEVYASLVDHLDRHHAFHTPPFDATASESATLADLSRKRIDWFIATARRERGFVLKSSTPTPALLTHLNLLDSRKPANGAVLLFGSNPQHFHRPAETKCVFCHGTEYRRPFASQQIYGGDLFEQADQARDFVLANPLIAEPLYLTRYIEKAGSGTQRMIELCLAAGLPEPTFELRTGSFVLTLWRDWLTTEVLATMNLNERQLKGLAHLKNQGRITNNEYQQLTGAIPRTAARDLNELSSKGILAKIGRTGRSAYYVLKLKRDANRTNRTSD